MGRYAQAIQGQHETALKDIALACGAGGIDKATFESSLEDEMETLRNELLVVSVVTKATAQKAANAFVDVLEKGIKAAVFAML